MQIFRFLIPGLEISSLVNVLQAVCSCLVSQSEGLLHPLVSSLVNLLSEGTFPKVSLGAFCSFLKNQDFFFYDNTKKVFQSSAS